MEFLQAHKLKTISLTKAMYTVIHRYLDEAFNDISEESEKITFLKALSLINHCSLFQAIHLNFKLPRGLQAPLA